MDYIAHLTKKQVDRNTCRFCYYFPYRARGPGMKSSQSKNVGEIQLSLCGFHSRVSFLKIYYVVFSSPELKAQVSFSDHLSSVVCLSVRPSVCLSVRLSVNFTHFHLLLQNHWAKFNQTWHKASLGKGDSSLFK